MQQVQISEDLFLSLVKYHILEHYNDEEKIVKELKEKYNYNPMTTAGIAEQEIKLGEDEYFVLCDSRVDSDDSRNSSFGMVKTEQIIGKVSFIVKPFSVVSGPDHRKTEEEATPTPANSY